MALDLPITLVAVDNVAHELTRLALESTLRVVTPKQVLIFTDDLTKLHISGADYAKFSGSYYEAMEALWFGVPPNLSPHSSHIIWIQWDSGAIDAESWTDEFLEYDYIGAPWPVLPGNRWEHLGYTPETNVGNGGFSLRSAKLVRILQANNRDFPLIIPEDDAICRRHRAALSELGFRWAPTALAERFSIENGAHPTPDEFYEAVGSGIAPRRAFGFHGAGNWMWALSPEERERRIAAASPFARANEGFQWMLGYHAKGQARKAHNYCHPVFNVDSIEKAKAVILTHDTVHTTDERWEAETAWIMGLLKEHFPEPGSVIDFGCGIGRLCKPLIHDRGFSALGVDISPSMRSFAAEYVGSPKFLCCAPEPFARMVEWGVRFDYALAVWSLQHTVSPADDIAIIYRSLKPGGRLFLLNAVGQRFVPTVVGPPGTIWGEDYQDIWAMFGEGWRQLCRNVPDPNIIGPYPKSEWAIFERLA